MATSSVAVGGGLDALGDDLQPAACSGRVGTIAMLDQRRAAPAAVADVSMKDLSIFRTSTGSWRR